MSGELNGTAIVVNNTSGEVVGQGDFTHAYGGTPIEIGNKSTGDNVVYLDGEGATKQHVFAGDFTYNSDAQLRKVRADTFSHTMDTYTLTYTGSGVATDESFVGLFMPNALTDTIGMGVKVTTAITFSSSGVVTITPAADA
jgi:hypothetical protein